MKINNIFNEKIDVKVLNNILSMLNAKPLKIKAKTITIKELLLLLVRSHRQQYLKMKKNKKTGGEPDSCFFNVASMRNPVQDYLNTSTLSFNTNFPPPPSTYYRDFI